MGLRQPGTHIKAVQKAAGRITREASISFVMTSMGISRLVVSKILNHSESGVTAVYDRHSYDDEKRQALLRWGDWLEAMVQGIRESG